MPEDKSSNGAFPALVGVQGHPLFPTLSTAALLAHPKNAALRALVIDGPQDTSSLKGKRIAIIVTDGVEEMELMIPLRYLRQCGASVDVVSPDKPDYPDHLGIELPDIRNTHIMTVRYMECGSWVPFDRHLTKAKAGDYDALFIPGGAWNPDALRADKAALQFVRDFHETKKLIATICHGPWVVGDAGVLKGKRAAGWWSLQPDIERAGATFVDEATVVDGNLITARHPIDLAPFLEAIVEALRRSD